MFDDSVGLLLVDANLHMLWYSLYSKATRFFNGSEQLVIKFVVVLIGRNVNPIETGRTAGERFKTLKIQIHM